MPPSPRAPKNAKRCLRSLRRVVKISEECSSFKFTFSPSSPLARGRRPQILLFFEPRYTHGSGYRTFWGHGRAHTVALLNPLYGAPFYGLSSIFPKGRE